MKKISITVLSILILLSNVNCTAPTQPIARQALHQSMVTEDQIVHDLATKGKYEVMQHYGAVASNAATANDASAARNAVKNAVNECQDLSWLEQQHERVRALQLQVETYIAAQQGIVNVIGDDLKKAIDITTTKPVE